MLITRSRRGRRRLATVLALALTGAGATVLAAAPPAAALPCNPDTNPNCPPPPPTTYHSTLTVVPPSKGTIVGRNVATDAVVFSCSAGGGTCSHTDSQASADGRPADGWPQYAFALDAASAPGYRVTFTGACSADVTCTVENSASSATLTASVHDGQPPTVWVSPGNGTRVAPGRIFTAGATDNDSVASYAWWVCDPSCGAVLGTSSTFPFPSGRAPGPYTVEVRAADPSGNVAFAQSAVTLVTSVDMTSSDVPAYAEHPSFTFSSTNEEAHVPHNSQYRQCRAWADDTPTSAWGPCTSDNSYAPALADGSYTLQARETDDLGLSGVVTKHVVVDTTAPTVTFTGGPADGATITTATATYPVTAADANLSSLTCAVNGTAAGCSGGIDLHAPANGTYVITATAVDVLGHITTATRHVTVHVPTTLTPAAAKIRATYGKAAPLSVTVGPAGVTGKVRFTAGHTLLCTATVTAGRAKCSAPSTVAAGRHAITASYAGNFAPSTASFVLDVAKAATSIKVAAPRKVRHGAHATLRVTGLPRAATGVVVITRSGHALCSARVRSGAASCRIVAPSRRGTYSLVATYRGDANHAGSHATVRLKVG